MNSKIAMGLIFALLLGASFGSADFKYTESAKMTGGALAGAIKVMSVFSKQMREPMVSTIYFKGNRMRRESADGTVEIIDAGAQRVIHIDTKHQTYSVMTFAQMRQMLQNMQQGMQQAIQQSKAQHNAAQNGQQNGPQNVQVQMKIHVIPTNQTQQLLGQTAQELKIEADMEMSGQNPNQPEAGTQSATMRMTVDSWMAPHVAGYEEAHNFYVQMAKELNWTPNASPLMNAQMKQAMVDLAKSGKLPTGFPLLQTVDFGMAGTSPSGSGTQANSNTQSPPCQSSEQSSSPQGEVAKAVLGRFGGLGHFGRKKHQESEQNNNTNCAPSKASGSSPQSASLMQMTVRVTSYSTEAVDASLFQVPAGYQEVQPNPNNPH